MRGYRWCDPGHSAGFGHDPFSQTGHGLAQEAAQRRPIAGDSGDLPEGTEARARGSGNGSAAARRNRPRLSQWRGLIGFVLVIGQQLAWKPRRPRPGKCMKLRRADDADQRRKELSINLVEQVASSSPRSLSRRDRLSIDRLVFGIQPANIQRIHRREASDDCRPHSLFGFTSTRG